MVDLLMGLVISLGGLVAIVFNKPIAKDGVEANKRVDRAFRGVEKQHPLWEARALVIFWGVVMFVLGLAVAFNSA